MFRPLYCKDQDDFLSGFLTVSSLSKYTTLFWFSIMASIIASRAEVFIKYSWEQGSGLSLITALSTLQARTLCYSDAFPDSHMHTHNFSPAFSGVLMLCHLAWRTIFLFLGRRQRKCPRALSMNTFQRILSSFLYISTSLIGWRQVKGLGFQEKFITLTKTC